MNTLDFATINQLDTDYSAATVVAAAVDAGVVAADRIAIVPAGANRNAYAKEIKSLHNYQAEPLGHDKWLIQVNREGFYDMLPEGLFHSSPKFQQRTSKGKMMTDIRKWREEEHLARQFFMPFESEVYHVRMMLNRYENRLDKKLSFREFPKLLEPLWPELKQLSGEQCVVWMHIIPLVRYKRNDLSFLQEVIGLLFGLSCQMVPVANKPVPLDIPANLQLPLGMGTMGVDTVIGQQVMEYRDEVTLRFADLDQNDIIRLMPGGSTRKILHTLFSMLMPPEVSVELQVLGLPKDRLSAASDLDQSPLLGYNAHLSNCTNLHY